MMTEQVAVRPFSGGCGAVVEGVDLAQLSASHWRVVRDAFNDNGLVFFRSQTLSQADHLRFAEGWGEIVINKYFPSTKRFPQIAEVRKEANQKTNIGGGWHADHSYDQEPALGSILVAREVPNAGGDTLFANLYGAYEALSDGLKATLEGLRAVHANHHIYGPEGKLRNSDIGHLLGGADNTSEATHPVVVTHPGSGRKALYVNPGHTRYFEGWTVEESASLLQYLYVHAARPEFTCRFRWEPGSVAFWDNRCTWHYAANDYHGQHRLMDRITIAGSALH
jgi:taurine dioxygenase